MTNTSPRDVFLQLFSVVALYIAAIAFGTLLFQYIDLGFPDPLDYYPFGAIASVVRGAMAALIIVFPIYLSLVVLLRREELALPEKRESRLRKWLIYFTLFVAAVVITSDLVSVVYHFLEGDLTVRFVLKTVTIFAIAGTVFTYYLSLVRTAWTSGALRIFSIIIACVVLCAIVAGFFTAGSPFVARKLRFDERRVSDLQMLQNSIVNYWQRKNALPDTLAALRDDISGFLRPPVDPATNASYEYRVTASLKFELCATFELASRVGDGMTNLGDVDLNKAMPASSNIYYPQSWDHGAGRVCFPRTIDPELYKPVQNLQK